MTVQRQYYLICDGCGVMYNDKAETETCVRDLAVDDGWKTDVNDPKGGVIIRDDTKLDFCPKCKASDI